MTSPRFQSTHPLRGATRHSVLQRGDGDISIHAPPAGCDVGHQSAGRQGHHISIHAPPAGCDEHCHVDILVQILISIHAPPAGCDTAAWASIRRCTYFNPRTPCGVRRGSALVATGAILFQSTHPLRGATDGGLGVDQTLHLFQSTHPLRGATDHAGPGLRLRRISIHAPPAGCDGRWIAAWTAATTISIHAPPAGCDCRGSPSSDPMI